MGTNKAFIVFAVIHLTAIFAFPLIGVVFAGGQSIMMLPAVSLLYYLIAAALPVFLFIRFSDNQSPVRYLAMADRAAAGIGWGLLIGILIGVVFFLVNGRRVTGGMETGQDIAVICGTGVVGMLEEIPFRGLYLQKFSARMGFMKANILTSALFALLHVPMLLYSGGGLWMPLILLAVVSLWLGYLFQKTRSFWTVALVHAAYNLSVYFFG